MNVQAKDKHITFRLEKRYLEDLERRAEEYGIKPNLLARMLLMQALEKPTNNLLLEQIEDVITERTAVLEEQFTVCRNQMLAMIKEMFFVMGDVTRDELDKILPT